MPAALHAMARPGIALAVLLSSCSLIPPSNDGMTKLPTENLGFFASVGSSARKLLADVGNARVELDPTQQDALTALGACADLLSYCYAPPDVTIAMCWGRARVCQTETPWTEEACCPVTCRDAFVDEVNRGLTPAAAVEKVLFLEPDCFPGVRAALEVP
jgi:hypothetical protein